jgi:hypothetical protein
MSRNERISTALAAIGSRARGVLPSPEMNLFARCTSFVGLLTLAPSVACSSPPESAPPKDHPDAATHPGDAAVAPDVNARDIGTPDAPLETSTDAAEAGDLPLGTVSAVKTVSCPPSGHTGGTCQSITVTCKDAAPIDATVLDIEPPTTPLATVVVHDGGGGTGFYSSDGMQPGRLVLVENLVSLGYRVVEISWWTEWEAMGADGGTGTTDGGANSILAAACRPATAFAWIFSNVHVGGHASPFCGMGHSAGSGAMAYSLGHYGLDEDFDYVALSQGPPFGRIDCGCDPSAPDCTPPNLCNVDGGVPVAYTPGAASFVGRTETSPGHPTTCGTPSASSPDIAYWHDTSVASTPAPVNVHYPKTGVSAWYCMNSNETLGLGSFYVSQIESLGGPADVQCAAAKGGIGCAPESSGGTEDDIDGFLTDGGTVVSGMAAAIQSGCKTHH